MSTVITDIPTTETITPVPPARQIHSLRAGIEQSEKTTDAERNKVSWIVIGWLAMAHLFALAAPFTFTWQAVVLLVIFHWLTAGIGVCLGYHRLLTHSSFKTYRPIKWFLAWMGGISGEGSAISWVADHRKHHALSDQEGDPHSPNDGAWWSHILWLGWQYEPKAAKQHREHWAPDLVRDPVLRWLDKTFLLQHFLVGGVMFGAGLLMGGMSMAISFLIWGVFLRLVLVFHSTWFVNSASHMWGYRNYETTDNSRNLWWVALISYGEGWHNNHHAYPRMAPHGHKWWEFDMTYLTIRALRSCGLAWDVVDYKKVAEKHA